MAKLYLQDLDAYDANQAWTCFEQSVIQVPGQCLGAVIRDLGTSGTWDLQNLELNNYCLLLTLILADITRYNSWI